MLHQSLHVGLVGLVATDLVVPFGRRVAVIFGDGRGQPGLFSDDVSTQCLHMSAVLIGVVVAGRPHSPVRHSLSFVGRPERVVRFKARERMQTDTTRFATRGTLHTLWLGSSLEVRLGMAAPHTRVLPGVAVLSDITLWPMSHVAFKALCCRCAGRPT